MYLRFYSDTFIHDRACGFDISKHGGKISEPSQIRYYALDRFHGRLHVNSCKNRIQKNPELQKRLHGVNTLLSQQIFSCFRQYAKNFNYLGRNRHYFLVLHFINIHNEIIPNVQIDHLENVNSKQKKKTSSSYDSKNKEVLNKSIFKNLLIFDIRSFIT